MTGDRFVLYKRHGRWFWELEVTNNPQPTPIARCGPQDGYGSRQAALRSMESARSAMLRAVDGDGALLVEERS